MASAQQQTSLRHKGHKNGFTVIELMITLIIAGVFLMSGYQLYGAVLARNTEARRTSEAANLGYGILRERGLYKTVSEVCGSGAVKTEHVTPPTTPTLPDPVRARVEYCKVPNSIAVIRVAVIITYGTPAQEVVHATYISG
jgi:prepilin-type cleavage/methylation N-terminal domain protein